MDDLCLAWLLEAVHGIDQLLILPHNDPDPDAIASAMALSALLEQRSGIESRIVYKGIIGRAENKALVRYLGFSLERISTPFLESTVPVALVDTQPSAGNNALALGHVPRIVIDHHPLRETTAQACYYDVRSDVGATSTMLTEYVKIAGLDLPLPLSTALFYGIKTDTMGLSRGARQADLDAYFYLQPLIDIESLAKIERAQVPSDYFKSFVATVQAARVYERVLLSYLGEMHYPDLVAEMADLLLRLEGIRWVVCLGRYKDELVLSVRTTSRQGGAGRLVQDMVQDRGSAGGHGMLAGGQVPLQGQDPGVLAQELGQRALSILGVSPDVPARSLL